MNLKQIFADNPEIIKAIEQKELKKKLGELSKEKGESGTSGYSGEQGISGYSGLNGTDGRNGKNGMNGLDGKDGEQGLSGFSGYSGKEGPMPETEDMVDEVIKELKKKQYLEPKDIKGMPINMNDMRWHGSGGGSSGGSGESGASGTSGYSGAAGSGSQTLAQTLAIGNVTGGNNIIISTGDGITGNEFDVTGVQRVNDWDGVVSIDGSSLDSQTGAGSTLTIKSDNETPWNESFFNKQYSTTLPGYQNYIDQFGNFKEYGLQAYESNSVGDYNINAGGLNLNLSSSLLQETLTGSLSGEMYNLIHNTAGTNLEGGYGIHSAGLLEFSINANPLPYVDNSQAGGLFGIDTRDVNADSLFYVHYAPAGGGGDANVFLLNLGRNGRLVLPLEGAEFHGQVDMSNNKIITLADPTDPLDAVNLETLQSFTKPLNVNDITADYSVVSNDDIINVDASGSNVTVQLLPLADAPIKPLRIRRTDDTGNTVTVAGAIGNPLAFTVVDSVGVFDGTATSQTGTMSVPGQIDLALSFNGSQEVNCGIPSALNFVSSFSMTCWVNITSTSVQEMFMSYGAEKCWIQQLNDGRLEFNLTGDTNGAAQTDDPILTPGTWGWLAFVYDAGVSEKIYFNNVEVASTVIGTVPAYLNSTANYLALASFGNQNSLYLDGIMDDVRFFNGAIDSTDMDFIWNSGDGTEDETTFSVTEVAHYKMNDDQTGVQEFINGETTQSLYQYDAMEIIPDNEIMWGVY